MKTTDPRDSLDQQIDALLRSRPLRPEDDFTQRVLAAAHTQAAQTASTANRLNTFRRVVLPLAAAIALVLIVSPLLLTTTPEGSEQARLTPAAAHTPQTESALIETEAHEIFLLEEGLSELTAQLENEQALNSDALLNALDALLFELES